MNTNRGINQARSVYNTVKEMGWQEGYDCSSIAIRTGRTMLEVSEMLRRSDVEKAKGADSVPKETRATKAQIITAIEGALSFEPGTLKDLGKVDRPTLLLLINRLWDDEFLS